MDYERNTIGALLILSLALGSVSPLCADDPNLERLLAPIRAVGKEGSGNELASAASKSLATRGPETLIPLLAAMDTATPIATNWLRGAIDTIAERAIQSGRTLPADELERFVMDRGHAAPARRLAFDWLARIDRDAPDRIIPKMIDDPAVELRRDAVARELDKAIQTQESGETAAAAAAYRTVLSAARDRDQVLEIAKRLEALGEKPDLTRIFGCLQRWHIAAPFDNTDKAGFDRPYPPEQKIDLQAAYDGKDSQVRWTTHQTDEPFGVVDLNQVVGKHMGVVAYATTELESPKQQPVSIRVGSTNAIKLWLNGKLIYAREEYHHGMSMDQYQAIGTLEPGRNTILLKVCQNEQKEDWAQKWTFQLRVCDLTGRGI